jgi:methionine synthase II (cobalamin-independent)
MPAAEINSSEGCPFVAAGQPTLIGSLPVADHRQALDWIYEFTPEIPLWPQLPSNPREGMMNQFIEGFPGIREGEKTFFEVEHQDFEEEILHFFEAYLKVNEDPATLSESPFALSRDRASGLYLLREQAGNRPGSTAVKGQITGPFTLLTGLTDQNQRLGYYEPIIRELVVKGLAMKGAWQVRFLRETGLPALLFIDEPALAGLGSSSFISISLDDIRQDLSETIDAVRKAGGLAGIHVCANTDWNFLLSLPLDILSFDAYGYFDRLATSRDQLLTFLERGGIIAWGLVPTSEEEHIRRETGASLARLWQEQAETLTGGHWDLPALLRQTLITPSCGTGSLSPELARRVLMLTRDLSAELRRKFL